MSMMYQIIGRAINKAGLADTHHPQDYLNFYCLGKRESSSTESPLQTCNSSENRALGLDQKYRRFMIYVHAKGMIVDDEYVLMGSANINQRSLDVSRDTEIAMGAYQPTYTWSGKNTHPRSQVYGYRMSLWAEHLSVLEDCFCQPETLECMRKVNNIAKTNWQIYAAEEYKEMTGHLMQYPIQVNKDGKVTT